MESAYDPPDNSFNQYVFVYGTLRKGEYNHGLLKHNRAVFLHNDRIKGEKIDLGPFPALREGLGLVSGEVYGLDDEGLKSLDLLEGHPHFYERRQVTTESGRKVWTYFGTGCLRLIQAENPSNKGTLC